MKNLLHFNFLRAALTVWAGQTLLAGNSTAPWSFVGSAVINVVLMLATLVNRRIGNLLKGGEI